MPKSKKPAAKKPSAKDVIVNEKFSKKIELKNKKSIKGRPLIELAEDKTRFVRLTVRAVIPTQQYGNIQPEITVEGGTYSDAKSYVMPLIEDLYQTYAMASFDGKVPSFFNKAQVTAVEKNIDVSSSEPVKQETGLDQPVPAKPERKSIKIEGKDMTPDKPPFTEPVKVDLPEGFIKSGPYLKAESAIMNSLSADALTRIETQIQDSVKIDDSDKPFLYTLALKKRKTL